jgi:hypothetical protein
MSTSLLSFLVPIAAIPTGYPAIARGMWRPRQVARFRQCVYACPAPYLWTLLRPSLAMIDPLICRLTYLLAAGDYPVQPEVKRRWIDLCSEVARCDDPEWMDDVLERITALVRQEKQRLGARPLS